MGLFLIAFLVVCAPLCYVIHRQQQQIEKLMDRVEKAQRATLNVQQGLPPSFVEEEETWEPFVIDTAYELDVIRQRAGKPGENG